MSRRICLAALVLLVAACHAEKPEPAVFGITEADPWTVRTRSLLTASDIETRKTGITLAAYADGTLATASHFVSGLEAMTLELEPDCNYTLYALVNMGDMTSSLPLSESRLDELSYRIPSYTEGAESLSSRGLPMAGALDWPGHGTVIPVQRLLAKVTAHLSCDWDGAAIQEVRVCNLNRILRPFGDAVCEEDWDQQEFDEGTGTSSGTFVFYVPENRQGTIGGITTSLDKSPDRNTTVSSREDELTYLETSVTSTESTYAGDITYRSYLGGNATTDFDLERNALYDWTIVYHGDRTQDQDWKRDGDIFRVDVTADRCEAYVGETVHLTATCHRSNHGAETVSDVTETADWTRMGGSANLVISNGDVTATAPGAASFHAAYTLGGRTAWADSPVITFRELPPLSASWTSEAIYVGQRGSIAISGLVDGATITEITSSDESVITKAAVSGSTVYVNCIGATGSATLTVKASNGQTVSFTVSPFAPNLLDSNSISGTTAYYGSPDGTDVNTDPTGHNGQLPAFAYYTGSTTGAGSTKFTVGSNPSPTVTYTGTTLAPDLYESILKPVLTVDDTERFGYEAATSYGSANRIWVKSLSGYPSDGGVEIGRLTVTPVTTGRGILPLSEPIFSVDPFTSVTDIATWPDFYDREMISRYVSCESVALTLQCPDVNRINADPTTIGWDVLLDGSPNDVLKELFWCNMNFLWFEYREGDALPHVGGECEVRITVTNPYSGESVGKTFITFKVIVCGVIAGVASVDRTSTFTVSAEYIGPDLVRPSYSVFRTNYRDGETLTVYGPTHRPNDATVRNDEYPHILGQTIYSVTTSNGTAVVNHAQVYHSIFPEISWTGNLVSPACSAYYQIDALQEVQDKIIHPDYHFGWIIEDD